MLLGNSTVYRHSVVPMTSLKALPTASPRHVNYCIVCIDILHIVHRLAADSSSSSYERVLAKLHSRILPVLHHSKLISNFSKRRDRLHILFVYYFV